MIPINIRSEKLDLDKTPNEILKLMIHTVIKENYELKNRLDKFKKFMDEDDIVKCSKCNNWEIEPHKCLLCNGLFCDECRLEYINCRICNENPIACRYDACPGKGVDLICYNCILHKN